MRTTKLLAFILISLLSIITLQADPITREQAMQKAERHLSGRKGSRKLVPVTNTRKLAPRRPTTGTSEAYYAFNRGTEEGFVLVAADDRIEPLLGYTDEGEFNYEELPDNMRNHIDALEQQVRYLMDHPELTVVTAPVHNAIPEMLTTRWNQSDPYWLYCPKYDGTYTVTGCVATAMAQVLYYQREKSVDEIQADIPGYTTETLKIAVSGIAAGSPIDWKNMQNSYNSNSTQLQKEAVARLMQYCGVSVYMDYDLSKNGGSGAQSWRVADAMNNYFGYGGNAQFKQQSNYNETTWDALIYNELAAGRVVYLSGYNQDYTSGHAFVCDGYDGNHCFHINWGWGGSSNSYFLLTALNPSQQGIGGSEDGSGFTYGQQAIIGCEPPYHKNKAITFAQATVKTLCVANWDTDGDGNLSYGEAAEVTDLGTVFQGANISSFNELYYFTGITTIGEEAFSGCTRLSALKFPKKLTAIKGGAFKNCAALKSVALPNNLKEIGDNAFEGCKNLAAPTFPDGLLHIGSHAFSGCLAFKEIILPSSLQELGEGAFDGCTNLLSLTIKNPAPQGMTVGSSLFVDIDLSASTLYIPQGTRSYFSQSETWNTFGTIKEMRDHTRGSFAALATNKDFYLYNVGTGRFLTKGEAWGTQAVVGQEPMRYQFRSSGSNYYLYSNDTGESGKVLFRTWSDNQVGKDIAACFVDGSATSNAYWTVADLGDNTYTLQIPSSQSQYNQDQFFGVNLDHESNTASPTYGAYSDISYSELPYNCQWRLVLYDADAETLYQEGETLGALLTSAIKLKLYVDAEQAVYDNMNSTLEEIKAAQYTLRGKLGYINFKDDVFRTYALSQWDSDMNGELSYTEAAKVTHLGLTIGGKAYVTLEDLQYFTGVTVLESNTFQACTKMERIILPKNVVILNNYIFSGCSKLKEIRLPAGIIAIGDKSFYGCSALTSVTVDTPDPANINLGSTVFSSIVSRATLYVPYGSKALYEQANQWKDFSSIQEVRGSVRPAFSPITTGTVGYIMHVGTGRYITKGEAYGTQAVAGADKLEYKFLQNAAKTEGIYYLYSDQTGSEKKVLFRTSTDSKIGSGVKACFVDGSAGSTAYWNMVEDETTHTFTMQVPATDATYTEDEFLGVAPYHESNFATPTYGLYWDVRANDSGNNIRWAFITKEDWDAAANINGYAEELRALLVKAAAEEVDATTEQAVYDNMGSTAEELSNACKSLMEKLHLISFADYRAHNICINNWDTDFDGYLSYEEAAAVKDIQAAFKGKAFTSLDELRYFTGLTTLTAEAFRGCSTLVSLYLPATLTAIENNVFTSCSALKYIAAFAPNVVQVTTSSAIPTSTLFVEENLMEAYAADAVWGSKCTVKEYTGIPTVTAGSASRQYGRSNPSVKSNYQVTGAPINGTPSITCDAVATTPAGEHPIDAAAGTITTPGLVLINGVLTIEKAPLTVTATSYTRKVGEENPEFEVTYKTFRNKETFEVLNKLATVTCEATPESPAGEYPIVPSGAEADNYEFTYVNGVLTVEAPNGIASPKADSATQEIYNLAGQRILKPVRGVNIIGKKKYVIQ